MRRNQDELECPHCFVPFDAHEAFVARDYKHPVFQVQCVGCEELIEVEVEPVPYFRVIEPTGTDKAI
jgi:hypothetical protein